MVWSPRRPDSSTNPIRSVDRNTSKNGRRYTHKDYNKTPKKSADAETETEPIKARHVQLCTPVKMGGAIIDPNQYLLEQFAAYQRVPELEAEVEVEKIQRKAVVSEFRGMRERIRGLQLALGGAQREREDAVELELLAVKELEAAEKERDAAIEKEKESARLLKMWQERAKKKKEETDRMRRKFENLQGKVTGKMGRAVARLAGAKTDKEVESACEKVAEMISADPEMESETEWSEDDAAC